MSLTILLKFEHIPYCILREGKDIDISIPKKYWGEVDKILREEGYIKHIQNFNLNHRGYRKGDFGLDIRDRDDWNGIYYLDDSIYHDRIKKGDYYYLDLVANLAHYVGHCVLGKRKWKYKEEITELAKGLNPIRSTHYLGDAMGLGTARGLLSSINKGKFPIPYLFVLESILNHPLTFTKTLISWIKWKFRPLPLIAIIGPDGSGKSTTSGNLNKALKDNGYPSERVYLGRGGSNIVPVNKIGAKIKKRPKWLYFAYSAVSFLDLFIRYWFKVFPKRYKTLFVSDRSYLDILTMKNIPSGLKRFYLCFFPKPNYIFYLYNDIEVLHERRPEHETKDLNRQVSLYNSVASIKIKTDNEEQTIKEILRGLF